MNSHDELVKRLRKTSVLDHPMDARHAMDIASLALQHADTRAAEDRALIQMLQKALAYWMPSVFDERSAHDAYLLVGYEGPDESECWGDMVKRDNAALMQDAAAQIQIAREAVERAAGLERDAARYRWLRRQAVAVRNYASGNPNWEIDWALRGESFEAAIDAALAQKEG